MLSPKRNAHSIVIKSLGLKYMMNERVDNLWVNVKMQAVVLNGSGHVSIYHLVWDPITISSLRMLLKIGLYVGITKDI